MSHFKMIGLAVAVAGLMGAAPSRAQQDPSADPGMQPPAEAPADSEPTSESHSVTKEKHVVKTENVTLAPPESEAVVVEPAGGIMSKMLRNSPDNTPPSIIGTLVTLGGGYQNFTNDVARTATSGAGTWNARLALGTRSIIGIEGEYLGSAQGINGLGTATNSNLIGTLLDGALRVNAPFTFTAAMIEPYVFGGLGWQNYHVTNNPVTSSLTTNDNLMAFPLGVGLSAGYRGITLDARFTYRPVVGSDMLNAITITNDNSLASWGVGGGLGFEF